MTVSPEVWRCLSYIAPRYRPSWPQNFVIAHSLFGDGTVTVYNRFEGPEEEWRPKSPQVRKALRGRLGA